MEIKVRKLSGFLEACVGLLGAKEPQAVYFKTRWGIHTFFMKFPIDVLILDDKGKVRKMKENLKPYRIFIWNPIFSHVLELPSGTIKSRNINVDSLIKLEIKTKE